MTWRIQLRRKKSPIHERIRSFNGFLSVCIRIEKPRVRQGLEEDLSTPNHRTRGRLDGVKR